MSCFTTLAQRIRAFEASSIYPVISSEFCQNRDPLEILKELLAGEPLRVLVVYWRFWGIYRGMWHILHYSTPESI